MGNIGRSQMAEAFYNNLTGTQDATSAGVQDVAEKYGYHPTSEIVATMKELDIDVSKQIIKHVVPEMLDNAETIVVLCQKEQCPPEITSRSNVIYRSVDDPFQQSPDKVRDIRDQVKSIVESLIKPR